MMKMRRFALAAAVALALPATSHAGLVFGGGPAKSDCYAAFDVVGATTAKGGRVVKCPDGSACDTDGQVNGKCTFSFRVCVLQPGDPSCHPPDVDLRKKSGGLNLPPVPSTVPACGAPNTATVKVNKHKTIRLTAHSSGKPHTDMDVLQLQCKKAVPSPSGAFLDEASDL